MSSILWLPILFLAAGALGEEARYTAEEIESLVSKNAWGDAIMHLPEVATGDRGKHWDELVEKVAVGYLRSLSDEDPSNAMAMVDTLPQNYPNLQRSWKYQDAVELIAYTGFKSCFEQKENQPECTKNLKEHVTRRVSSLDRANTRFCKDEKMSRALGDLCPARKADPKGKRAKP